MAQGRLVRARGIAKSFGATHALVSVDLDLRRGQIHALLGGNGAGKSTLIGILDGRIAPDSGELEIDASAVAVVHQELAVLPELTVAENIDLGFQKRALYRWQSAADRAVSALALLGDSGAGILPDAPVDRLPLHQRQLVEIARALRSGAELILLDEPTASLTVDETDQLFRVLRSLAAQGIGIVLVSHRMHEIRQVATVASILRDGRTVVNAAPVEALTDSQILHGMFGSALDEEEVRETRRRGQAGVGEAAQAVLRHPRSAVEISLSAGRILGLAGAPQGPGELMDALIGVRRRSEWEISVDGRPWAPRTPRSAIRRGVGYVSGDRASKGVFPDLTISENAILADQIVAGRLVRRPNELVPVERHARDLGFSHVDLGGKPSSLSGGTLQKVLIARWLDVPIRILVLEEPTRGVDVKTKAELYELIHELTARGIAVVWWSTEASELIAVSDDILAFSVDGTPSVVVSADETDESDLLAITGTVA